MTDAMTDVEVFKASAEACGKEHFEEWGGRLWFNWGYTTAAVWNPFLNADQRWECEVEIVKRGWYLHYHSYGCSIAPTGHPFKQQIIIEAPMNEAAARALAELHRRSK